MVLGMAAVHTTADLTKTTLLQYAQHPEIMADLRKELIEVMPTGGWDKVTLYKLKLLDSSIKEAQRLKPIGAGMCAQIMLPEQCLILSSSSISRPRCDGGRNASGRHSLAQELRHPRLFTPDVG
jgi:hypothetical protein